MKLSVVISAMILMSAPLAWANTQPDEDGPGTHASVVAKQFDPTKKECNCTQPAASGILTENRKDRVRVAEWITSDGKGAPPALDSSNTAQ